MAFEALGIFAAVGELRSVVAPVLLIVLECVPEDVEHYLVWHASYRIALRIIDFWHDEGLGVLLEVGMGKS
jgi:hypothetical protein